MVDTASGGVSRTSALWVRRFHASPQRPMARLVCFPHAGGSAAFYLPLSQALGPRFEVLAIQYPGRHDRLAEPCLDSVAALAAPASAALAGSLDGAPFAVLGHSLGAAVAYETALLLQGRGEEPAVFFASARRAPSSVGTEARHLLPDVELIAELGRLGGTDPQVLADPDLMDLFLPALRADLKAAETYHRETGAALSCPIHALIGDADPQVTPAQARDWAKHTSGAFGLTEFRGGHFFLSERSSEVCDAVGAGILRALGQSAHR
jgi:surfactin synthase thioesterase subunit